MEAIRRRPSTRPLAALLVLGALVVTACTEPSQVTQPDPTTAPTPSASGDVIDATADAEPQDDPAADEATEQRFPDVIDAELEPAGDRWRLSATVSSPYDSPDRYADAFRALTPDGSQLGVRELLHDHAGEQPFTRSLEDLEIPVDVDMIVVDGRDLQHGWGGATVTIDVPR